MLFHLLKFEIQYQLKQRALIAFSILFAFLGYTLGSQGFSNKVAFNSNYEINYDVGLLSLGSVFIVMFFAISGFLRDKHHKTDALVFTSSLRKIQFFMSRFLGVYLFSLLTFSACFIGWYLGTQNPALDASRLLDFNVFSYLNTWLLFAAPNLFIVTAIVSSVALLTQNNIATYVSAIGIYGLYFLTALFFNSPLLAGEVNASAETMQMAAIGDPFGLSAFLEQTQFWTPAEKNTQQLALSGYFLANRLFWLGFTSILLFVSYSFFSYKISERKKKSRAIKTEKEIALVPYRIIKAPQYSFKHSWKSFVSQLKMELNAVRKNLPFLAIIGMWIVIVFIEIYSRINQGGTYNESLYPTTSLLVWLIKDPLPYISILAVVFYGGELIWREKETKFDGILYGTPASTSVFFLAKTVALILLPCLLICISILIAIGFQIQLGYEFLDFTTYASLFYFSGVGILFYILLSVFMQSVFPNKYFGTTAVGVFILLFNTSILGIENPLFRIGVLPKVEHTLMNGFSDTVKEFHYYAITWLSLAVILTLVAYKLWQRNSSFSFKNQWINLQKPWKKWQLIALSLLGILFLSSASAVYYNSQVIGNFETSEVILDKREAYERMYKQYDTPRQLIPVDMKTEIHLFPEKEVYTVKVNFVLENRGEIAVENLLITEVIPTLNMQLEKGRLKKDDTIHEVKLFEFETPIQPKERINYSYEIQYTKKGFEQNNNFVKNGTFLMRNNFDPILGYSTSYEVQSAYERSQRNLPKRATALESDNHFHSEDEGYIKIPIETVISTSKEQTAIAPGDLVKQWEEGERNYYQYKIAGNAIPFLAYFSAAYTTTQEEYKGIDIEQYYHQNHDYNVELISESTRQTIDYCQQYFGKFPYNHVRIAEVPGHWRFGGIALPGTIAMVADNLHLIDVSENPDFNLVAKRTIHEVAHQYWGHLLTPKNVDGGGLITEGLAKYTEAVVLEKMYGKKALWQLSKTANQRYFSGRSYATQVENPLYIEQGQSHLLYGKSLISLLALKDLVGEEKMNQAIKNVVDRFKDLDEPQVLSIDLLNEFYQITPKEYHHLIDDWFQKIIRYDLKINYSKTEKLADTSYQTTLNVSVKRFEIFSDSSEEETTINEPISIGFFDKQVQSANKKEILYLKSHHINSNETEIILKTSKKPKFIVIDPYGYRPEKDKVDNVIVVN
ncbi:M1 family aminopeptidase [Tenacibaculum sp. 190524A02b]|uniref:M1 family aminopeptidase n=1 Tax=Tenacibaculum vairaonense TaxID=3137860 RepID=UPI0031FABFF4